MSDGLTDANRDEKNCRHGRTVWRECIFCVTTQERNDLRRELAALRAERDGTQARVEAMKAVIVKRMHEVLPCSVHIGVASDLCDRCRHDLFMAALVDEATKKRGV